MLTRLIDLTGKDLSLWRLLYLFKGQNQNAVIFTYFLYAADKSCPMLRGSTVIVVNDDHTHATYIRSIFGRLAYCYMLENSLGHWKCAKLEQLVRSLTAMSRVKL